MEAVNWKICLIISIFISILSTLYQDGIKCQSRLQMEVDSNFHIKKRRQVNNEPIRTKTKTTNKLWMHNTVRSYNDM